MKAHRAHLTLRSHARRRHGLVVGVMACSTAAESRNLQIVHGHFAFTVSGKEYTSASAACAAYLASLAAPGKHQDVGAPDDHGEFVCAIDAGPRLHLAMPTPLDVDAVGGRAPLTAPAAASVTASGSPAMARAVNHAATWAPSVVGTVRREHLLVVRRVDGAGP